MKPKDILQRRITELYAKIELPVWMPYAKYRYGSPEYWERYEKELLKEASDLQDFIRDHRSRDGYGIWIEKKYEMICKFCGASFPEDYDGFVDCCDQAIDAQKEYTDWLQEGFLNKDETHS